MSPELSIPVAPTSSRPSRDGTMALVALTLVLSSGCAATSHPVQPGVLGKAASGADLLASLATPGPLQVETIVSADWQVPRGGLINLDHEKSEAAGLEDGDEPIEVYFHVIRHPTAGTFIIDTGFERALRDAPDDAAMGAPLTWFLDPATMKIHVPLGDWIEAESKAGRKLGGVFLTHLHLDHAGGVPDVPKGTPIYVGPGESTATSFENMFVRGTTNRTLEGHAPLSEWNFAKDPSGRFAGVLDVFGDGSLWAVHVPGHTMGSTAFIARGVDGPVLFTGDASHTRWGWENDVEPGTFSVDQELSAVSLAQLRKVVAEVPGLKVRFGHKP